MRILRAEEMRAVEQNAARFGFSFQRMMENAGAACARNIRNLCEKKYSGKKNICVVCGKGNNGGDGFVIARKLHENGYNVGVIMAAGYPVGQEATESYKMMIELGIKALWFDSNKVGCINMINTADLIADCVYGFGFYGELSEDNKLLFEKINISPAPVVSVDLPSGVYCDNGYVCDGAVKADYTIAISSLKPAHISYSASEYIGEPIVVDIGIPKDCYNIVPDSLFTLVPREVKPIFPKRDNTGNKGTFGTALLICGSRNMVGAAELSVKAALRSGAGLVKLAFPECAYIPLASKLTEPILIPLEANDSGTLSQKALPRILEEAENCDAILIGCGLGLNDDTVKIVSEVIANAKCPIIIDADGINAVACDINMLRRAAVPVILTPHPKEMSRLIGVSVANIQADRIAVARNFAESYLTTLVLKGANTVVACDNNRSVFINSTGNTGLSKGGSGDFLAGLMVGFAAQGIEPFKAAQAAVYIHGYLGEVVSEKSSVRGMLPGDMIAELPKVLADFSE